MRADILNPAQNVTVNVTLFSDKNKWTQGYPGKPVFTLTGGSGDAITEQAVLDGNTAVLGLKIGTSGTPVIISDGTNGEGVTLTPLTATQFTAMGRAPASSPLAPRNKNAAHPDKRDK